jgi:hypothetical protein
MPAVSEPSLVNLPPLPLNSAFGVEFVRSEAPGYTGLPLMLALDNLDTGTRVTLTEADATVSGGGGLTVTFAKNQAWTATSLNEGRYTGLLFVNGTYEAGVRFDAWISAAGEVTP